jgi:hypothetical protein
MILCTDSQREVTEEPSEALSHGDPSTPLKSLELGTLEIQIRQQLRDMVQDFELSFTHDGLVLRGRARSFYAKQLAQQQVMQRSNRAIAVNAIIVDLVVQHDDWLPP